MKIKKILIVIFLIALILIPVCAFAQEEYGEEEYGEEEYNQTLEQFDLSFLEELDEDTYKVLDELGLTDFDHNKIIDFSFSDIADYLKEMIADGVKKPLYSCGIILLIIILSSFFQGFRESVNDSEMISLLSTVSALVIAVLLVSQLKYSISSACAAISVCADFIFAFVPAFCIIVATSGNTVTAFSTNTLLLSLAQALNFISENIFLPLSNCFLAIGICSGIRSELNLQQLIFNLKKYLTTAISVCATAFVSILSIKTAVSARADAIGLRSMRFAINSVVPVIGGAISEGLLSIQAYSSLIKSSVGIVGIIAVLTVFVPPVLNVSFWRLFLSLCRTVSDIFNDRSVSSVLKAFEDSLLIMNVILILSMVTTIISIGILIAARGS